MFEIAIFCIIFFAMSYWATLFMMGRREDVLHGQFVEPKANDEPVPVPVSPVPTRPLKPMQVVPVAKKPEPEPVPVAAPVTESAPLASEISTPAPATPAPVKSSVNPESLQLLLASLKQELKNAAQI